MQITFGTIHKPIRTMHKARKFASIFNYKLLMKERYFSLSLLERVASLNLCFEPTFEVPVRIEIMHVNNLIIQNIATPINFGLLNFMRRTKVMCDSSISWTTFTSPEDLILWPRLAHGEKGTTTHAQLICVWTKKNRA